jgi:hypothetical protein
MIWNRCAIITPFLFALAASSIAATPEQVGDYSGTIVITTYSVPKVKAKKAMTLSVAADDTTTVTIDGAPFPPAIGTYTTADGFVTISGPAQSMFMTLHFKKNSVTGVHGGGVTNPSVIITDGKLKLKKVS